MTTQTLTSRILVADDNPGVRTLVRRTLESRGYSVLEASDGREALRLIAGDGDIDLLITDVNMPVMSGPDLVASAHSLVPTMPVLYLTGYGDVLFAERTLLPGGEAFLAKPFATESLLAAVRRLMTHPWFEALPRTDQYVFPEWIRR